MSTDTTPPSTRPAAQPDLPPGFKLRPMGEGFVTINGPLYSRLHQGRLQAGFRVEARHCNPAGTCHGGMLATLADMICPITAHLSCEAAKGRFLPTISLQLDYMASARLGEWVQAEAQVLRATRTLVFVQGLITADDTPVVRLSGVFKIGPEFKFAAQD